MKITKTSSGKNVVKISKKEWEQIGIKQKWICVAAIGMEFLKAKGVPQQNIPVIKEYLDSLPDNTAKFLMKNYIIKNPNISIQELKQIPIQTEKITKVPEEMEALISKISEDKIEREWLRGLVVSGRFKKEDSIKIYNLVNEFHNLSEGKLITEFKDDVELSQYVQSNKRIVYSDPSGNFELLENEYVSEKNVKLYRILDQAALDSIGGDASWCVLTKNGKVNYDPFDYYCLVVDGEAEVLIHQGSGQIKDKYDGSLRSGTLVKLMSPYIEKYNILEGMDEYECDVEQYQEIKEMVDELEHRAFSNNSEDQDYINGMIENNFNNFTLLPKDVWDKYVSHFGDEIIYKLQKNIYEDERRRADVDRSLKDCGYDAIEYLATYFNVNNNLQHFDILRKNYSDTIFKDQNNLTTGRYTKLIPSILRTKETNKSFNAKRGQAIHDWKNAIDTLYFEYSSKDFVDKYLQCPFAEVQKEPDLKEKFIKAFKYCIENGDETVLGIDFPTHLKEDQDIKEAKVNAWIIILKSRPYDIKICPEEIRNDPKIKEARIMHWIEKLKDSFYINNYNLIPEDIKSDPRIKKTYIDFYLSIYKNLIKDIRWMDKQDVNNFIYLRSSNDIVNDPQIQNARLEYLIGAIQHNPYNYGYLPKELKNDDRILSALPQEYKQKLGITAKTKNRLFSSAFNDNYIGKI
jgi:hypothetical protein